MFTFSLRRKSKFGSRRNGKCCHDLDFNVTVKSFCVASCLDGVHDAGVMCCRLLASTDGDLVDGFVSFRLRHRIYYVKLLLLNGVTASLCLVSEFVFHASKDFIHLPATEDCSSALRSSLLLSSALVCRLMVVTAILHLIVNNDKNDNNDSL